MKYNVVHPGARDYYSLSEGLYKLNKLNCLYTDFYNNSRLKYLNKWASNRKSKILPPAKVKAINNEFVIYRLKQRIVKQNSFDNWTSWGKKLSISALKDMKQQPYNTNVWGFTCANLETIKYANESGGVSIHTQIDGGLGYYLIKKKAWEKYPFAETKPIQPSSIFLDRVEEELSLAKQIIVNSNYIKQLLEEQYSFLVAKKVHVLPLAFDNYLLQDISTKYIKKDQEISILWVGNINIMKGFVNYYEAAKTLAGKGFRFIAAGHSHLTSSFFDEASKYITFVGKLNKTKLYELYNTSHVFLFPSLCDSFGIVQLEAMNFGLPVIATRNCGDVVTDGYNGFKIKSDNSLEMIEKLIALKEENGLYSHLSSNAITSASNYNVENYSQGLSGVLSSVEDA